MSIFWVCLYVMLQYKNIYYQESHIKYMSSNDVLTAYFLNLYGYLLCKTEVVDSDENREITPKRRITKKRKFICA